MHTAYAVLVCEPNDSEVSRVAWAALAACARDIAILDAVRQVAQVHELET
jgi:hypothetical protein